MRPHLQRQLTVVAAAIGLHVAVVWALQTGLMRRAVETLIPVQVMADFIEPPQPQITPEPPPQPQAAPQTPRPRPLPAPPPPMATPSPEPAPIVAMPPEPAPAPPQPVVAAPVAAPSTAPTPAISPPAPPVVVPPSSNADYLNNPRPTYPALSRRLGEQGTVVLRVLIEADGTASRAEIRQSSGYERLDQTALQTVLRWRYVPGKRAGVAEAMWFNVPISFVLE